MKTIQRNTPPGCLSKQHNNQPWGDFARTSCHTETRKSLFQEQCGLCCYCESPVNDGDGHIEHIEPRKKNQNKKYDYANLALSCNGGKAQHDGKAKHCGHFKDAPHNHDFTWDPDKFSYPHDSETCSLFSYDNLGHINPTTLNPDKAWYMIGYLGLDCSRLVQRRHSYACLLIDTLNAEPDPKTVNELRELYLSLDKKGYLQQFYSLSKAILEP